MKNKGYFRVFEEENKAYSRMVIKNQAHRKGDGQLFAILEHPEGWAVMDLRSAVETELPYSWSMV